jgi:hypothetical protein
LKAAIAVPQNFSLKPSRSLSPAFAWRPITCNRQHGRIVIRARLDRLLRGHLRREYRWHLRSIAVTSPAAGMKSPFKPPAGLISMNDAAVIEELYRRFHSMSGETYSDRIMHLRSGDLPFADADGNSFGNVKHLIRGDDKSGAAFDIYRLGWFGGRVWELVIVDGAYLPHAHQKINSEFFIVAGGGHLSRNHEWIAYQEKTRVSVGMAVAHGFITDPDFGQTVFLSIQSDPIRKILIDPDTLTERFEDDFVYVDDVFPLPRALLNARKRKLKARA